MQNILDINKKLEAQQKIAYSLANTKLNEEQNRLEELLNTKQSYEDELKTLVQGKLDFKKIHRCREAIEGMKPLIRNQVIAIHRAEQKLEQERIRLNEIMIDRKTHENLRDKAFDEFKEEQNHEESKITDELVSYQYHSKK